MEQDKTTKEERKNIDATTKPMEDVSPTSEEFLEYTREVIKEAAKQWGSVDEQFKKEINNIRKSINNLKKDNKKNKEEIVKQGSKNIEIIGLFSAVLAMLIIDVNIIKSAPYFLAAILLITGLTSSLMIFASLIHRLFSCQQNKDVGSVSFLMGTAILVLLIIAGIYFYEKDADLYTLQHHSNTSNEDIISGTQDKSTSGYK